MQLENQVCSLELSQKLKSLGVKQESLFHWSDWLREGNYGLSYGSDPIRIRTTKEDGTFIERTPNLISAFTVAELGEMLPPFPNGDIIDQLPHKTIGGKWRIDLDDEGMLCCEKTEADARAKMLIYLLENKLITI